MSVYFIEGLIILPALWYYIRPGRAPARVAEIWSSARHQCSLSDPDAPSQLTFNQTKVTLSSGLVVTFCGTMLFQPGDTILVLGENGAGKTIFLTLLHSIYDGEERGSILTID